jgi:ubiquinone/menaquinone biosynthesis C-methylase UbiE
LIFSPRVNLKLLVPSYRTRYLLIQSLFARLSADGPIPRAFNLGTGQGEYDYMVKGFCRELHACDINVRDIEHARELNRDQTGIIHAVQDAQALTYPTDFFDAVLSVDVIEHVQDCRKAVREMSRVCRPGGHVIVTAPSLRFPPLYDPVNWLLNKFGRHAGIGAWAYGHFRLIDEDEARAWFAEESFRVLDTFYLSKHLVGLLEMYWMGLLRSLVRFHTRTAGVEPAPVWITDLLVRLDEGLFRSSRRSVGIAFLLRNEKAAT